MIFYIQHPDKGFLTSVNIGGVSWLWVKSPKNGWMDAHHFEEREEAEGVKFVTKYPGAKLVWVD